MQLRRWLLLTVLGYVCITTLLPVSVRAAQEAADESVMEEVVVIGRYKSAATDVVSERMDADVPVDMLDAEAISRTGDSDVAAALRRIPGLTLVQDKFVYVRGLGERYSVEPR